MLHQILPAPVMYAVVVAALAYPMVAVFDRVVPGTAPGHTMVYLSAWVACAFWLIGAWEVAVGDPLTAVTWATGAGFAALHNAVAMHCAHGWSRAAAYAEIERVGGFGGGLYVNDAFVAVWVADAVWRCVAAESYRRRPRCVGIAIHGFLAFVVFNAVVVFARWPVRVAGAIAFAWLGWVWWVNRPARRAACVSGPVEPLHG